MVRRRSLVLGLSAALLVVAAGHGNGKTASGEVPEAGASLAGQLLVAAPQMRDLRFRETVIVMLRHEASGALGVIINQPVAEQPLAALLEAAGQSAEGVAGSITVHFGGPVEPTTGFVVHSAEYQADGTLNVTAQLATTRTIEVLRDIGQGKGPKRFLFALGYAGWAPGQLEAELTRGDWFTAPGELGLIFDAGRDDLWEQAMARRTRSL